MIEPTTLRRFRDPNYSPKNKNNFPYPPSRARYDNRFAAGWIARVKLRATKLPVFPSVGLGLVAPWIQ